MVLARGDSTDVAGAGLGWRPWSLSNFSYDSTAVHDLPECSTVEELLMSLRRGTRHHISNTSSYFVPYNCTFRWYSKDSACEISSRYSDIGLTGDSLSRHHTQGLFMIYTEDWKYGGIPLVSSNQALYDNCVCDGQFSEHEICRDYGQSMFNVNDPHSYGICYDSHNFAFRYNGEQPAGPCRDDLRPRIVLLQGASHMGSNLNRTINEFVIPRMTQINEFTRDCTGAGPVHVLWSGMNSQARALDPLYPHQSREHATAFNNVVDEYVESVYGVQSMNFENLTADAAVSDGFHYLSEVNILKAMYLLNVMDMLTPGQRARRVD